MSRSRDLANLAGDATGLETLTVSDITDLTATATELNYVDGVGSAIQTQINAKAPIASPTFTGTTTVADFVPATPLSHRNMIINGAMNVFQRGGSLSITQSNDGGFALDRFKFAMNSQVGQLAGTMSQYSMSSAELNTTGFAKALKFETTTPENSWDNDELAYLQQIIEAQNLQHLQYGTASAKSVTLSFWVKSSVTGTFAVGLYKQDTTSRITNKTITISDTDWNKYTLTFSGDTDSGATIANDTGAGIYVVWHLGAGSTYNDGANTSWENYSNAGWAGGHVQNGIVTTNGATWYLTGVQLEIGSVATPFEHRSYADELQRCLRYYYKFGGVSSDGAEKNWQWYFALGGGTSYGRFPLVYPVQMRAVPTISNISTGGSSTGIQFPGDKSVNFYANSLSSITKIFGADINAELL